MLNRNFLEPGSSEIRGNNKNRLTTVDIRLTWWSLKSKVQSLRRTVQENPILTVPRYHCDYVRAQGFISVSVRQIPSKSRLKRATLLRQNFLLQFAVKSKAFFVVKPNSNITLLIILMSFNTKAGHLQTWKFEAQSCRDSVASLETACCISPRKSVGLSTVRFLPAQRLNRQNMPATKFLSLHS